MSLWDIELIKAYKSLTEWHRKCHILTAGTGGDTARTCSKVNGKRFIIQSAFILPEVVRVLFLLQKKTTKHGVRFVFVWHRTLLSVNIVTVQSIRGLKLLFCCCYHYCCNTFQFHVGSHCLIGGHCEVGGVRCTVVRQWQTSTISWL